MFDSDPYFGQKGTDGQEAPAFKITAETAWTLGMVGFCRDVQYPTQRSSQAVSAKHEKCVQVIEVINRLAKYVISDVQQHAANIKAEEKARADEENARKAQAKSFGFPG